MRRRLKFSLTVSLFMASVAFGSGVQSTDSPFGVVCPWVGIGDAGIEWVRCGAGCTALDWGAVNPSRGKYNWAEADKEVRETCEGEKASLLVILGYTPAWASSGPNGESNYPPEDLRDWSDFVFRIASRYKDRVKCWEVWNEPDIGFWQGSLQEYTELLKAAYVAAKKADPDCLIVLGGTAGVNVPFLERLYELGCKEYFDVMAVHPYQWGDKFDDRWFVAQLNELHKLMRRWGDGRKEIWLTEIGWSTSENGVDEETQANLLAQAMITVQTLLNIKVTKCFWFCVKDWGGPGYGLIRTDGSHKPAFQAYRETISYLKGSVYKWSYDFEGVRCHLFGKNGVYMLALWSPDKSTRRVRLPEWANWIKVVALGGPCFDIVEKTELEVGHKPVFVYGKGKPAARCELESIGVRRKIPAGKSSACEKRKEMVASRSYRKDVWYSLEIPQYTSRLWLSKRNPEETPVIVTVHNDSDSNVMVELEARVGAFRARAQTQLPIPPGASDHLRLYLRLPTTYRIRLDTLEVRAKANGIPVPSTHARVRISEGPTIEFLANSTLESKYLFENQNSGCGPSVRFGGTWVYRFDLSNAALATLDVCVGAHQANEWSVMVSPDNKQWRTLLAGRSDRSWHRADLSPYAGGIVFLKFTGNDQQLSELVLTTKK